MGKVEGIFLLGDTFVPIGRLPDLSNSLLIVTNRQGSLLLAIHPSNTNRYQFQIVAVTSGYKSVSGSGQLMVSPARGSIDLVLTVHSSRA
jgi:hypothetical protein